MTDEEGKLFSLTFGNGWRVICEPTLPGIPLVEIPELALHDGTVVHAVFVRGAMNGYSTRLFLDRQLPIKGNLGLTTHPLLGKVMFAHSIRDIPSTVPPHEAVLAHLRMYE